MQVAGLEDDNKNGDDDLSLFYQYYSTWLISSQPFECLYSFILEDSRSKDANFKTIDIF